MEYKLGSNPLVQHLQKPAVRFTKADIIRYIEDHDIKMVNFRYVGDDGRLKALNFVINSREHLEEILTTGERVDGSSLFKNIGSGASDLYVVPRFKTAFVNPFSSAPAIDLLCSYYDKDGNPLESSPEYVLRKAHRVLKERTGYDFQAMGELEYYIIAERDDLFQGTDQKGYHESSPFSKWSGFREEVMNAIAQAGGQLKYGHSEVGNFSIGDYEYEQNELEFLPVEVEDAADQLIIAKWILRNMAWKYGVNLTFAPKITVGKAGSGLHVHTRIMKDGVNAFVDSNGVLSDLAKRAIAGYLELAPSLTAFGNTIPASYFRLVPHQEAPTNICWGDRNRSTLVRVPLGWQSEKDMCSDANPLEVPNTKRFSSKQTIEFRCPDGSADIYLLMAGLTVAARHGIEMESALEYAAQRYVSVNIFDDENQKTADAMKKLPACCEESAKCLQEQAEIYMKYDVFPRDLVEGTVKKLARYNDKGLLKRLENNQEALTSFVKESFHCG